jgi:hypothetical protein
MNKELKQTLALILDNQRLIMSYLIPTTLPSEDLEAAIEQTQLLVIELNKEKEPASNKMTATSSENTIFNCWNDKKKWHTHAKIQPHLKAIRSQLNAGHSEMDICGAILNYIEIVEDERYFYSHKSSLKDFMSRHLLNFLDTADPTNNYRRSNGNKPTQQTIISNEAKEREFDKFNAVFEKRL